MSSKAETTPWLAEGDDKRQLIRTMFADIAPSYDLLNGLISLRQHKRWRRKAVAAIQPATGDTALDLCTGTGDFLLPLRRAVGSSGTVIGIDFCQAMLQRAVKKLRGRAWLGLADAGRLPLCSRSVSVVTVGWGLRNVPDVSSVLAEIARVLKPGGRMVSLDMAQPHNPILARLSDVAFHRCVPLVGRLFGKGEAYTYLPKSTKRFLSREEMQSAMERAGFDHVEHRDFYLGNVCMHWGCKR
ncbi:MAG: bifunctional demethylmenaquinone methyltransferase/2-methoxy-6-polyprenyl-1,4-benzoquinol methylase UbiE [Armatimonadetes bacterium]|nr:bifunctional demethylmenaquinone methyltransferase/2-methoxy-6-polyprenyl-1,4-benzoquinol methylase UbiE [Armatimonadota bacterium]